MDWDAALWAFIGVLAGGGITFFVSRYYCQRASIELRSEAENLRRLNILTISILDEARVLPEHLKPARDEAGEYTGGFSPELTALSIAANPESGASQTSTNTPEEDPKNEEEVEDGPRQE